MAPVPAAISFASPREDVPGKKGGGGGGSFGYKTLTKKFPQRLIVQLPLDEKKRSRNEWTTAKAACV